MKFEFIIEIDEDYLMNRNICWRNQKFDNINIQSVYSNHSEKNIDFRHSDIIVLETVVN